MLGLGFSIPQVAMRGAGSGIVPPAIPFFASTTQHWGDGTPAFGKAA